MGLIQNSHVSLKDMSEWMLADTTAQSQDLWWNDGLQDHIATVLWEPAIQIWWFEFLCQICKDQMVILKEYKAAAEHILISNLF